jgi:hypothetical protein
MSRKKTYYPTVNAAIYHARDTLDEFANKCIEKTAMTDPELTALRNVHTAITAATAVLPRYHEER